MQIARIISYYLSLQPHERDNLSVVLFDCDSELLPEAVVDEIRGMNEDEEQDAMCQVLLAHSDKMKLRALYRTLCRQDEGPDSFNSSEATRDFMARLRINILVADSVRHGNRGNHPYDIVFAENTIARRARLRWEEVEVDSCDPFAVKPSSWSRRRPMRSGPVTSAVYMTSPRAPRPVWSYIGAISRACEPDQARHTPAGKCLVPCRVLGVNDEEVGLLIARMHDLGAWVVNYDELLHRNLLSQKGIRIIRYKQDSTQGKNLIISSKAKIEMLAKELGRIAIKFLPELDKTAAADLALQLITEANGISGNLVLRAVRRRENAKELFGLVLSKHIVCAELQGDRRRGWFLLDDFASWLGEDEKQIADILCLSPGYAENEVPILDIIVTEAKFVQHDLIGKKAKESAAQLRQSLQRLESGLDTQEHSLDREIWLARISDMIVDGMEMPGSDRFDASKWRRRVRDGGCALSIRGFSHVFDDGPEVGTDEILVSEIGDTRRGMQELYSFAATRRILSSFVRGELAPRPEPANSSPLHRVVVSTEQPPATIFADPEPEEGGSVAPPSPTNGNTGNHCSPESPKPSVTTTVEPDGLLAALGNPPSQNADSSAIEQWAEQTTMACRKALLSYGMQAEIAAPPVLTPNSLLLRLRGTDKLTRDSLEKKSEELRTTHALDVIGVRPELGVVTTVISRPQRQVIFMSEVWRRWKPTVSKGGNNRIVVAVKEEDNQLLSVSPVPLPHTLVSGMTGSGKSVLLQNLILSIAATNTPAQAKIAIIDPKFSAQLQPFGKLPHMFCPIINEQEPSLDLLAKLANEMDERNKKLSEAEASDIDEYIQIGYRDMPRTWLIFDEYGDWIRDSEDYRKKAWPVLDRLAMKARSSGIYLVLAAQRPDNSLFSMVLRSNLGNRLALVVADQGTSDVATGVKGLRADRLLGNGHLLAMTGEHKDPVYAQVPLVSTQEVRNAVKYITSLYAQPVSVTPTL
jgi:DNA segregation ATPase FtsK/SpoIIIE, S-DNA-T family